MPRRDGEGLVVTFNPLELATLLDGLLRGGIDATGGLGEVEDGFTHNRLYSFLISTAITTVPLFKMLTKAVIGFCFFQRQNYNLSFTAQWNVGNYSRK